MPRKVRNCEQMTNYVYLKVVRNANKNHDQNQAKVSCPNFPRHDCVVNVPLP